MSRCYGHNLTQECPTPIRCGYRKMLSRVAWAIIGHVIWMGRG